MNENGKRLNLFPQKRKKSKVSSNQAFDMMNNASSKEERHLALAMAGMVPGPTGIAADLADIALYAKEGDFKNMGWSALAAVPILGQVVAAKKFWKAPRVLADLKLSIGKGFENTVNKGIVDLGMKGEYKNIGKASTKVANYDISATKN